MRNRQTSREKMYPSESLPQSMTDIKLVVFKARFDQGDIQLIGETIKPCLFSRFGFKPRPEDIRILCSESYFEPYLIIGGKYALDYCKKQVFKLEVEKGTSKVFVAGQELRPEKSDPKATNRIIKITGEERSHYERQAYFILDRLKREIPAEKLPLAPFYIRKEETENRYNFKTIRMSDEEQIAFLRTRIAKRPSDVGEIIKEVFDITDRMIAYYPMYQLTFENAKNRKVAITVINGITGEVILNGVQRIFSKTIVASPKNEETQFLERDFIQFGQEQTEPKIASSKPTQDINILEEQCVISQSIAPIIEENTILGFPAKINGDVFVESEKTIAIVGDVEVPPHTIMDKALVVKGNLTIGDCCIAHGKLEALKNIKIGADTLVKGDLLSEGNITVGPRAVIAGALQAAGSIKIFGGVIIERGLHSNPKKVASDLQFQVEP
jgi:cytoskeletal protein CcmA (bactofilin family)